MCSKNWLISVDFKNYKTLNNEKELMFKGFKLMFIFTTFFSCTFILVKYYCRHTYTLFQVLKMY